MIDKKKKEIDSMKKNKDEYKIDPKLTSIKKKEQRKLEKLRKKANLADDLHGVNESQSEFESQNDRTRIIRDRILQNQSREESVNDGGLGLSDVLGNADAILDGIALDSIGNGLDARDLGSKAETKMVALKLKDADGKFSRMKARQ